MEIQMNSQLVCDWWQGARSRARFDFARSQRYKRTIVAIRSLRSHSLKAAKHLAVIDLSKPNSDSWWNGFRFRSAYWSARNWVSDWQHAKRVNDVVDVHTHYASSKRAWKNFVLRRSSTRHSWHRRPNRLRTGTSNQVYASNFQRWRHEHFRFRRWNWRNQCRRRFHRIHETGFEASFSFYKSILTPLTGTRQIWRRAICATSIKPQLASLN